MKIKGSTGKISRTIILHVVFIVLQSVIASSAVLSQLLKPETYAITFLIVSAIHSGLGVYLRQHTSRPLT